MRVSLTSWFAWIAEFRAWTGDQRSRAGRSAWSCGSARRSRWPKIFGIWPSVSTSSTWIDATPRASRRKLAIWATSPSTCPNRAPASRCPPPAPTRSRIWATRAARPVWTSSKWDRRQVNAHSTLTHPVDQFSCNFNLKFVNLNFRVHLRSNRLILSSWSQKILARPWKELPNEMKFY